MGTKTKTKAKATIEPLDSGEWALLINGDEVGREPNRRGALFWLAAERESAREVGPSADEIAEFLESYVTKGSEPPAPGVEARLAGVGVDFPARRSNVDGRLVRIGAWWLAQDDADLLIWGDL